MQTHIQTPRVQTTIEVPLYTNNRNQSKKKWNTGFSVHKCKLKQSSQD